MTQNKLLIGYVVFAVCSIGFVSSANAEISVYQELTEEEQQFIDALRMGYDVTYTVGVGVQHIVDGKWVKFILPEADAELTANIDVYEEEVTVPLRHPLVEKLCRYFPESSPVFTQCAFIGPELEEESNPYNLDTETENGCLEGYERDLDNLPMCVPLEDLEAEAMAQCFENTDCPVGMWEDENGQIVNLQEGAEESFDAVPINESIPEDAWLCSHDIGLYQDGTEFEVPIEVWIDSDGEPHVRIFRDQSMKSIDLSNYPKLSEERRHAEACVGQWNLEQQERIDALGKVPNSEDIFPYHGDVAFGKPAIGQDRVNALQNEETPANIKFNNLMCNGAHDARYMEYFGCDAKHEPTPGVSAEHGDVFPDWMAKRIRDYNENGGANLALEAQRDKIQQEIQSLQNQLRGLQ